MGSARGGAHAFRLLTTMESIPQKVQSIAWNQMLPASAWHMTDAFIDGDSEIEVAEDGTRSVTVSSAAFVNSAPRLETVDGLRHPLYPQAPAVAWPQSHYVEFMESAFQGQPEDYMHRLILHEKAHFLWAHLFDDRLKGNRRQAFRVKRSCGPCRSLGRCANKNSCVAAQDISEFWAGL